MSLLKKLLPESLPDFDPFNRGDNIHGDVRASLPFYEDAFGKQIADATANEHDIATHYNFSPERVRLFRNGSREFVQYNSISQFEDAADVWKLKPDAGDTMHVETAESITYVVNYEIQPSMSVSVNQSLSSGDTFRIGPYNGTDGWVFEQRGADHADDEGDIIESVAGTETTLESDVTLPRPITDWTRFEPRYNWYNVGNQIWTQTYTEDGEQVNRQFAKTSVDGERGPETGNLNIWFEIQADASTSGVELNVGSMGAVTLGRPRNLTRAKPQRVEVTLPSENDIWNPIYAVRIDPDNDNVNVNLTRLEILSYGNNSDVELVAASFDASKTNASGWGVPEYHHAQNSAIQDTTSVTQVANSNGTVEDFTSSDKFGGHTLASAQIVSGGNTIASTSTATSAVGQRKSQLSSDHMVFLARTGNGGATLRFVWNSDQNW